MRKEKDSKTRREGAVMIPLLEKCKEMMNVDRLDEKTTRMIERW